MKKVFWGDRKGKGEFASLEIWTFWCLVKSKRPTISQDDYVLSLGCPWNPLNPINHRTNFQKRRSVGRGTQKFRTWLTPDAKYQKPCDIMSSPNRAESDHPPEYAWAYPDTVWCYPCWVLIIYNTLHWPSVDWPGAGAPHRIGPWGELARKIAWASRGFVWFL